MSLTPAGPGPPHIIRFGSSSGHGRCALPGDAVPHEVPPVFRRGCQPAVNLDVEAVAVEALVRAVGGKVGDGASLAEGV